MSMGYVVTLIRSGVLHVLLVSAPLLIIALIVGLVISIFQATTSIQEQTLTFVPKIAAILGALIFFGPWMIQMLTRFTVSLMNQIPMMVR